MDWQIPANNQNEWKKKRWTAISWVHQKKSFLHNLKLGKFLQNIQHLRKHGNRTVLVVNYRCQNLTWSDQVTTLWPRFSFPASQAWLPPGGRLHTPCKAALPLMEQRHPKKSAAQPHFIFFRLDDYNCLNQKSEILSSWWHVKFLIDTATAVFISYWLKASSNIST